MCSSDLCWYEKDLVLIVGNCKIRYTLGDKRIKFWFGTSNRTLPKGPEYDFLYRFFEGYLKSKPPEPLNPYTPKILNPGERSIPGSEEPRLITI